MKDILAGGEPRMNGSVGASAPFPKVVVSMPRIGAILDRTTKGAARMVILRDPLGEPLLRVDHEPADDGQPSPRKSTVRTSVVVRGDVVAYLEATGELTDDEVLSRALFDASAQLSEAWGAAEEIDSLASEIIHAYEELHLLYELGAELTRHMSVANAARLILDRLGDAIPASWIELRLEGHADSTFARGDSEDLPRLDQGRQRLVTPLRSSGEAMGEISLLRAADASAFTSADAKLLDGVGTIAASALHNALLYEQLCSQAIALSEREANLTAVMDNVAEGIVTVDQGGLIASFNPAAEKVFGYAVAEVVGRPFSALAPDFDLAPGEDASRLATRFASPTEVEQYETFGRRKDGATFPMEITVSAMRANGQEMLIVSLRDVTERRRWEEVLEHRAHHDALTDLPNRDLLSRQLAAEIGATSTTGERLALLLMDLDHFKEVNDTLGHLVGDRLLQQIGSRLRPVLRQGDLIARLGGDEFAILLGRTDLEAATGIASELIRALDRPFVIDGHSLCISASIGIAICPDHGHDAETLLKHSDVAMYEAKRAQCGYRVYSSERDTHSPGRLELKGELRLAIERNEFVLHYQPQVDLRTGRVSHAEALVRWQHPTRGLMMPAQFVGLAEQVGMIDSLSRWILDAALRQVRAWLDEGHEITVAVNLSAQNLRDAHLPETVMHLLKERGVPPDLLKIEITETSLMADPLYAFKILSRLSAMGIRIGIDDFGTGYSSLAYLKRLPVDEIKIDKSFVLQMASDDNDQAIVRSTIGLGHDLGLVVVAEGVENLHTQEMLSGLGCDFAQGYYLGRPVPPGDLLTVLAELKNLDLERVGEAVQAAREHGQMLVQMMTGRGDSGV